jgi:predicted ATPase
VERQRLEALLCRERLVTLLGPPGMGKTRLALEWREGHAQPVCWADLATASSLEDLCAAVASALDVPFVARQSAADQAAQIGAALAARRDVVVVLDGLETVTRVAAATLPDWIATAPRVRFLVTSRERLRLAGEAVLDLPPLGLPGSDEPSGDALALFVDRARAVRQDWTLSRDEAPSLCRLVRALDGIPLAIELAAARARVQSPRQLLAGLPGGIDVLGRAPGGGPARLATLRAAIDWSWRLLPPAERTALAQLSVFRGPFDLDAARAVLSLDDTRSSATALDVLESLSDKSLIRTVSPAPGSGDLQFALYGSVREVAAEALAAEGDAAVGAADARQAAWVLATAKGLRAGLDGPAGIAARQRLAGLRDDLLAAFHRAMAAPGPRRSEALEVALALDPLLVLSGPFSLRRTLLAQALAAAPADAPPALLGEVLDALADAQRTQGDAAAAAQSLERASQIAEALDDTTLRARVHATRGRLHATTGRFDEAEAELDRALELLGAGPAILEARARAWRGIARVMDGRPADGARDGQAALATFRRLGAIVDEAIHVGDVAAIEHRLGNFERAADLYRRALDVHGQAGNRWALGRDLTNFALLHHEQGRRAEALAGYERAIEVMRLLGDERGEGVTVAFRAMLAWESGRGTDARLDYERALALHERTRDWTCAALAHACSGALAAGDDSLVVAQECFAAADRALARGARSQHAAAVRVHRGHLLLCQAREAERAGRTDAARGLREEALRLVEEGHAIGRIAADDRRAGERSADLRFAVRLLERAAGERPAAGGRTQARAESAAAAEGGALVIAQSGLWLRPPRGERVSLERRRSLRLLVQRLADRRREAPGEPVAVADLVRCGWPGEDVHTELGAGRVYTALSTLRRLGLRPVLLGRDDGYLLDPSVPLVRADG